MSKVIKVGMADLNVCKAPDMITTLGLGSCIGIAVYDPVTKVGGRAHIMLPDSTQMRNNSNIAKFADTGIEELQEENEMEVSEVDFDEMVQDEEIQIMEEEEEAELLSMMETE